MADVRFYLDENVQVVISEQLQRRNLGVVTARSLGVLGDTDANHLERANRLGYVFCTHDADFLDLAWQGVEHAGIVFGCQHIHTISDWVETLILIQAVYTSEEMKNRIEYVL